MKRLLALSFAVLGATAAWADAPGPDENLMNRTPTVGTLDARDTREALAQATLSGDLIGLHGVPFNMMSPRAYPPKPTAAGLIRTEVVAELYRAMESGDMLLANESGLTARQAFPHLYTSKVTAMAGHRNAFADSPPAD